MKRIAYTLILVFILIIAGVAFYVYYKPHRNVESESPNIVVGSTELFHKYMDNEKLADSLYLNKIIEVTGEVGEIIKDQKGERVMILKEEEDIFGVVCTIDESDFDNKTKAASIKVGDIVKVKGICSGFDSDVKLNKCVVVKVGSNNPTSI
jgi:hypothetical protein